MKLASFERDGKCRFGAVLSGERVLDLEAAASGADPQERAALGNALAFLEAGGALRTLAAEMSGCAEAGSCPAEALLSLRQVRLLPPVPQARKLFALAGNYMEHVREGGRPTYKKEETYPYFFMKPPSTGLVGSGEPVRYGSQTRKLDYEGELAVVVGRRGKQIPVAEALHYVAGYTILNDISERGLASKDPPRAERDWDRFFDWLVGKWFDTGAPCGPWLVTADDIPDPHALRLQTRVNGELRQDGTTADMVFRVPEIVAFISRFVTLEPGDIISTGTPSGVGSARGVFLKPGDSVEVEIERIGVLRNTVVEG